MIVEGRHSLNHIRGNVYRFGHENHFSILAISGTTAIIADPISRSTADWIKRVVAARFGAEIRFVFYSHDHADHITGGEAFPGATIIAHDRAARVIAEERRPTRVPTVTFSDRLTIDLPDAKVDLIYFGLNSTDNTIVAHFSDHGILFAVDIVGVATLPHREMRYVHIEPWIDGLKQIERLDFDILAPGHGPIGTKDDLRDHRSYVEELYRSVWQLMRAGHDVDEIVSRVRMERYADWTGYEKWLEGNVRGAHRYIDLFRRPN